MFKSTFNIDLLGQSLQLKPLKEEHKSVKWKLIKYSKYFLVRNGRDLQNTKTKPSTSTTFNACVYPLISGSKHKHFGNWSHIDKNYPSLTFFRTEVIIKAF